MTRHLVFVALLLMASTTWARERREFYLGVRSLGMGGTAVASVNDETALILNPAGLGRLRDFYATPFDPELELGTKLPDLYKSVAFSQPFKLDSVVGPMVDNQGSYYHARGSIMPSFVARNFGIGLLLNQTLSGEALSATEADIFSRDDMALLLGYNLRLWDGRIKIGFTGKVINRIELNEANLDITQPLDASSLATAGLLREGTGVGFDVGMQLALPWTWLPTLGAVAHDVGGMKFDQSPGLRLAEATTRPESVTQDLDVGIAVSPIHANNMRSMWTIEYKGVLTAADETDKAKLLHLGTEFNFSDVLFLRAGYHQRYWTAGAELASEDLQFQIASYGEEVGDETAPREDRRVVFKFALRF